jgi:hypothetical protein
MKRKRVRDPPGKPVKLEKLTEKDVPEYERTRNGLVKVLEKVGGYEPAVDDILVDQIARTEIQVRNVEIFLDSEQSTVDTYSIVADSKLKLMKIIDNAIHGLALSRRDRLGNQTESSLMRMIKEELLRGKKPANVQ